jgi:hypothetical protein
MLQRVMFMPTRPRGLSLKLIDVPNGPSDPPWQS